jgi:hypothetical protein
MQVVGLRGVIQLSRVMATGINQASGITNDESTVMVIYLRYKP